MGFMTEMSLLNDDLNRLEEMIRNNPEELIQELRVLINGRPTYGPRDPETGRREYLGSLESDTVHGAHLTVHRSHHADDPRLYLAHQNMFLSLNRWSLEREYGHRLNDENDHLLISLERAVNGAEYLLRTAKDYLKEKKEQREKQNG